MFLDKPSHLVFKVQSIFTLCYPVHGIGAELFKCIARLYAIIKDRSHPKYCESSNRRRNLATSRRDIRRPSAAHTPTPQFLFVCYFRHVEIEHPGFSHLRLAHHFQQRGLSRTALLVQRYDQFLATYPYADHFVLHLRLDDFLLIFKSVRGHRNYPCSGNIFIRLWHYKVVEGTVL